MKSTTKAKRLPADLQTAVDTQFQRSDNKVRRPYLASMIILPSAAKNAPSMAWTAILTVSLVYMNHTCCKFGSAVLAKPTWRYSGSTLLAALTWQHQGNQRASSISHKKGSDYKAAACDFMEPATRLELVTPALRERCSTN